MLEFKAPQTQDELDGIVKDAVGKATDAIRDKMKGEQEALKTLKAELDKVTAKMKEAEDAAAKDKAEKEKAELLASGKYDEALKKVTESYEAEKTKLQKELEDSRVINKSLVVGRAIIGNSLDRAIDPNDVVMNAYRDYDFDVEYSGDLTTEPKITVKRKDGSLFVDDKGTPGGIELLVSKTLEQKPHWAKPASQGGAGTQHGISMKTGPKTIQEQIQEAHEKGDRTKVIRLKAQLQSQQGPHVLLAGQQSGG